MQLRDLDHKNYILRSEYNYDHYTIIEYGCPTFIDIVSHVCLWKPWTGHKTNCNAPAS